MILSSEKIYCRTQVFRQCRGRPNQWYAPLLLFISPAHTASAPLPYPHVGSAESSSDLKAGATVSHSDKLEYCLSENVKWSIQSCYFALNYVSSTSVCFSFSFVYNMHQCLQEKENKIHKTLLQQAERMLRDMTLYDLLSKVLQPNTMFWEVLVFVVCSVSLRKW